MKKLAFLPVITFLMASCGQQPATTEAEPVEEVTEVEETVPSLTLLWETDTNFRVNESVLYHDGVLYVSNIAGMPTEKNGTGFIAKLSKEGQVEVMEWAKDLDAPKGMGVLDGKMYVTNITELVEVDMASGEILNRYPVEGSEFLNDVAIGDGKVFFSDMNTGKLHVLENGEVKTLAQGKTDLNGLAFYNGQLYGVNANGLQTISEDGTGGTTINGEIRGGDGLVVIDENTFLVSRWVGEIWLIQNGEATKLLDSKEDEVQTADIGYIHETQTVLVPRFFSHKVSAYKLNY